jgi:hypothetical protein
MPVTHEDLASAASAIANYLSRLNEIEHLEVRECGEMAMRLLVPFLNTCHTVKSLHIDFYMHHYDEEETRDSAPLQAVLHRHPYLESVKMTAIHSQTLQSISAELATIPNLKVFEISDDDYSIFCISSLEDVTALITIISTPSLRELYLCNVHFDSEDFMETVCNAISRAQLTHLHVSKWIFPDTMHVRIARALITCPCLTDLKIETRESSQLDWRDLGSALVQASPTLQSLSLKQKREGLSSSNALALLEFAHQWKISSLTLHVNEWTKEFDQALANYVRNTPCLQHLDVDSNAESCPPVLSTYWVEAVRCGTRTLESIEINRRRRIVPRPSWLTELKYHVEMNRLRRVCAEEFQGVVLQPVDYFRLVKTLSSASALFEYLVPNEFNLLTFVIGCKGSSDDSTIAPLKRKNSRKRTRRQRRR